LAGYDPRIYVRVHVGPDDALLFSVGQLIVMIEFIRLEFAHLFLQCRRHLGIREKREAVLCCPLSAPHGYNNVWLLTIMANVVASCAGSPLDPFADDNGIVRVFAVYGLTGRLV
jgi:hypothetical protein